MTASTQSSLPPPLEASAYERSWLLRRIHRNRAMRWGTDPGVYDARAVEETMRWAHHFFGPGRYFGLEVKGLENVPPAPAMLVSNHSGGTTIPDVWGFAVAWYDRFGTSRPLHLMTHEVILATEATGRYFATRGALRASEAAARVALTQFGRDVIVMPGGEMDAWRPHRRRWQVEFAGRTGYAKLALRLGVPIVPVAHAGPHETLWVITDGRKLARTMRLHHLARAEIWPIHVSLPWGLALGPWPHIPLPARFSYRVGAPIWPEACDGAPTAAQIAALDERVRGAVQVELDDLARSYHH